MKLTDTDNCIVCIREIFVDICTDDADFCKKHIKTHVICEICKNPALKREAVAMFSGEVDPHSQVDESEEPSFYLCRKCAARV